MSIEKIKENIQQINSADEFLKFLKKNNIILKKLKSILFGETACKVIKAIKIHGNDCFIEIKKDHLIWYCTKTSLGIYINQ